MIKPKKHAKIGLKCILFCYSAAIFAVTNWQCSALDQAGQQWSEQGNYQLMALNRAFQLCKNQSQYPQTCKAAKENCEMMLDGVVTLKPMWRCMAMDEAAIPWFSTVHDKAADAVIAAEAYCRAYSALPSTCYIDPVICRNLNVWSP